MGFYISIYITFHLCQETGKPFYYGKNFEKIYDLSNIPEVPQKYRRFLYEQNNRIFPNYMRDDHYYDSAEAVFDQFPKWEDMGYSDDELEKYCWSKEDHDLLYEALKWFTTSYNPSYTIQWG